LQYGRQLVKKEKEEEEKEKAGEEREVIKYKGLQSNVLYATTKSLLANADYDRILPLTAENPVRLF